MRGARSAHWSNGATDSAPGLFACDTRGGRAPFHRIMDPVADPKSVKVNVTTGTGMEIEWKDGHQSAYSFPFLRDACPCALCNEERERDGRQPGDPLKPVAGALPMFKAAARPTEVKPVGKYAITFHWNDGHEHGIYSWMYLRDHCPCGECKARRAMEAPTAGKPN